VVVVGAGEDDGALVEALTDGWLWLTEVVGAPSWAAAPVGSTCWSELRTTQNVATRPAV